MKQLVKTTYFPSSAVVLGGAISITRLARVAHIQLPGFERKHSVSLSKLPREEDQSAFNVADAAVKYGKPLTA